MYIHKYFKAIKFKLKKSWVKYNIQYPGELRCKLWCYVNEIKPHCINLNKFKYIYLHSRCLKLLCKVRV